MKQRRTDKDIVQPRALKTRENLLISALKLYSVKGYHNTTVDQIASQAGLSTGVAYRYFKNKKELLIEALSYAFEHIREFAGLGNEEEIGLLTADIDQALDAFEKLHVKYFAFHEELEGLRHSDDDVRKLYDGFMKAAISRIYEALTEEWKKAEDSLEKLYIAVGLMENYCHVYMHGSLDEKSLIRMRRNVISEVKNLIKA